MSARARQGLPLPALLLGAAAGWFTGGVPAQDPRAPEVHAPPSAAGPVRPAVAGATAAAPTAGLAAPAPVQAPPPGAPATPAAGPRAGPAERVWLLDLTPAEHEARVMRSAAWNVAEGESRLASVPVAAAASAEAQLRAERAVRAELLAQLGRGRDTASLRIERALPFELLADPALHAPLRLDQSRLARQAVPLQRTTTEVATGTLLLLEEGVYGGPKGPRFGGEADSLIVRGAGRDRSVIVWDDWRLGELSTVVLQDLTVVLAGNRGLEGRSGLRCEATRCRFVLGTRERFLRASEGTLLLFEDCLFEAGFGSGVGSAKLPFLDVRRGLLARFRACAFSGPLPLFRYPGRDGCVVFDRVRGLGAFAGGLPLAGGAAEWLLPLDTELPERPDPGPKRPAARRYAELNPAWAALDR